MNIPEEAVEAAAWKLDPSTMGSAGPLAGRFKQQAMADARAALEAAAPLLMAQALREVLTWAEEHHPWIGLMDLKDHIEERANELEGK